MFSTRLLNGRIEHTKEILDYLKELPDGIISLDIVHKGCVRRKSQNAYYWKLLEAISEEIGESKDKCHDLMVYKFLGQLKEKIYNQEITRLPQTSKLTVKDFTNYVRNVETWATEFLGIEMKTKNPYDDKS